MALTSSTTMRLQNEAARLGVVFRRIAGPCVWHSGDEWALSDTSIARFGVMDGRGVYMVRRIWPNRHYSFVAEYSRRSAARAEAARLNSALSASRSNTGSEVAENRAQETP